MRFHELQVLVMLLQIVHYLILITERAALASSIEFFMRGEIPRDLLDEALGVLSKTDKSAPDLPCECRRRPERD